MLHGHAQPAHEARLAELARDAGFAYAAASHEVDREVGFLARGETTAADAYLTPVLQRHVAALAAALPRARLRFMQSSGGLAEAARFRGPAALLSGPAGGGVAAGRIARAAGFACAVGFDMGGTSTDVCLLLDGEVERAFETSLGGVHVRTPMMRIHTVAAGGGSLCRFDGFRLTVGPESAGADPGPLCYGLRDGHGAPAARELTLTDANLALGRLPGDRFPFPLQREPVDAALGALALRLREAGFPFGARRGGGGLRRGGQRRHGRSHPPGLGGARRRSARRRARGVRRRGRSAPLCAGATARDPHAPGASAGRRAVCLRHRPCRRRLGRPARLRAGSARDRVGPASCRGRGSSTGSSRRAGRRWVMARDPAPGCACVAASTCATRAPSRRSRWRSRSDANWAAAFAREHESRYGYARSGRAIEIVVGPRERGTPARGARRPGAGVVSAARCPCRCADSGRSLPARAGARRRSSRARGSASGARLVGPALILDASATLVVDPGFALKVAADGLLVIEDESPPPARPAPADARPDPVSIEVFGNRFMSIAEQMGAVLRKTAVSTNIKERLDYSCAVFDADAGLVANAPHIPVHLGAMGETVRAVREDIPDLAPGDVAVTNDPFRGGSHLPDITVVTPVFVAGAPSPAFFVATRGHHADVGGRTPGSMPADSKRIEDEGVLLRAFRLVRGGRFEEERVRAALGRGAAIPPARRTTTWRTSRPWWPPTARGRDGCWSSWPNRASSAVARHMRALQDTAGAAVARELARLPQGALHFADALDDGTPVAVRLDLGGGRLRIDFTGTGPAHPGNLNAPRAVVRAAVLYVLRCLVAERIPLNDGCFGPVELIVPPGSLLDPPAGAAVVGGNVETSQRIVDTLLGALGLAAASQGTMNNVAFGNERFGHYETLGGGAGAGPGFDGASAVHVHMTNTRITDPGDARAALPGAAAPVLAAAGFRGRRTLARRRRPRSAATSSSIGSRCRC